MSAALSPRDFAERPRGRGQGKRRSLREFLRFPVCLLVCLLAFGRDRGRPPPLFEMRRFAVNVCALSVRMDICGRVRVV